MEVPWNPSHNYFKLSSEYFNVVVSTNLTLLIAFGQTIKIAELFQRSKISLDFFALLNENHLNQEVFMKTEQFRKTYCINILWLRIDNFSVLTGHHSGAKTSNNAIGVLTVFLEKQTCSFIVSYQEVQWKEVQWQRIPSK